MELPAIVLQMVGSPSLWDLLRTTGQSVPTHPPRPATVRHRRHVRRRHLQQFPTSMDVTYRPHAIMLAVGVSDAKIQVGVPGHAGCGAAASVMALETQQAGTNTVVSDFPRRRRLLRRHAPPRPAEGRVAAAHGGAHGCVVAATLALAKR